MGFLSGLLTLPLAPVRGVVWVAEQLYDEAQREMNDPAVIRRQLMEVERARKVGTISDEEAAMEEAELVERLWGARRANGGPEG